MANLIAIIFLLVFVQLSTNSITIVLPVCLHSYKVFVIFHAFKSPLKQHVLTQCYELHPSVALALIFSLSVLPEKKTGDVRLCHVNVNKVQFSLRILCLPVKTISCEERRVIFPHF